MSESLPEPWLLFHAAEHARRHSGQIVTTAAILRGLSLPGERFGGSR